MSQFARVNLQCEASAHQNPTIPPDRLGIRENSLQDLDSLPKGTKLTLESVSYNIEKKLGKGGFGSVYMVEEEVQEVQEAIH